MENCTENKSDHQYLSFLNFGEDYFFPVIDKTYLDVDCILYLFLPPGNGSITEQF